MSWLTECHNAFRWGSSLGGELLKARNLVHLVLLAALVTLAVGVALFLVDSNIKTPLDGIWSAWVTMTHVGFGDVVPVSFVGRLLAAALILFGLVFFSLFTALVSVALIGRNMDVLGMEMRRVERKADRIEGEESRILRELARINGRLDRLEQRLPPRGGSSAPGDISLRSR